MSWQARLGSNLRRLEATPLLTAFNASKVVSLASVWPAVLTFVLPRTNSLRFAMAYDTCKRAK